MEVHGQWRIGVTPSRVLVVKAWDGWNEEAARQFATEVREATAGLADAPWALLCDLLDWRLAVPGAEAVFRDLNQWGVLHGCTHAAQVTGHQAFTEYQRRRVAVEVPETFRARIFDDVASAAAWLDEEGFELSESDLFHERPRRGGPRPSG